MIKCKFNFSMMRSLLFSLCLLLSTSISLLAQSSNKLLVSGYVKDAANGEGLIGVSVFIKELGTGATTNAYGYYSVTLPKADNYTLVYTYIGYDKFSKTLSVATSQKLDIELKETAKALEEVKVSAKREDDNVKSIEMSVNKVEMKTIRAMPALLGEVDLVRSIQLLPGVSTVGEGSSGFNVRGGDVSQNLILLDEAPVYNSSHLFGFFSVFNPDAVKDVKLIKGGIPSLYGGRISSILDVRMKEGNSKKTEINGGIGAIFSRFTIETPIVKDKGSFIFAARRSYADILAKPFLTGDLKNAQFYYYDLTAKANYKLNEKNTVYLSGYLGRDVFGNDFGFNWGNTTVSLRWNHVFNDRLFLNTTAYYSNYDYLLDSDLKDTNQKDRFRWNSKIISTSLKPDFTYYLNNNNQITFGGQYIHYDSKPGSATAISSGNQRDISLATRLADESALYIGNDQKVNRWLSMQYGLRYSFYRNVGSADVYNYQTIIQGERRLPVFPATHYADGEVINSYSNFEPRFSAKIETSKNSAVKLSYNRTTQYLHLLSNTAASSPLDVWTLSSREIKPEIADQVALGYFRNFSDNVWEASIEGYYKDMQNQIDYVRNSDLLLNQYLEGDLLFGKGRAYGLEFYLRKNKGQLTGWISYTLSRTERQVNGINNNDWFASRFDKTHNLSMVAMYEFNKTWSASANFAFSSGTPATFPTNRFEWGTSANGTTWTEGNNYYNARYNSRIPSYHRLDLSATKKNKKKLFKKGETEWVFSIYNVYNRRNPFSVFTRQNETDPRITEAVRYAVFGSVIPAVTYNFKF
jgi:CarboxypepD_reg-like domain/TonB dependent receptor/TonB-dependent Receptor Plug Domain